MADGYLELSVSDLQSPSGVAQLNQMLQSIYNNMSSDTVNTKVFYGYGTPEAQVTANVGSIYMRQDGGANTSVYRKESGGGNTGWVASSNVTLPLSVANGGFGADNSGVAQGNIFYVSAAGVISALGPGTSGQFLKTQGAAANPLWASAGALSLISATSFSSVGNSGAITIGSGLYRIKVLVYTTNGIMNLQLTFNASATGYAYNLTPAASTGTPSVVKSDSAAFIQLNSTVLPNGGAYYSADLDLMNNVNSNATATIRGLLNYSNGTANIEGGTLFGWWAQATATSFTITTSSSLMTGVVYLYKYSLS